MNFHNTSERNIQIVLYLLKAHGIKKVVASPGATDVSLVASMQHDPYFEMYSCLDERSAAYMACGMAAESGEPVMITCTGATSSRNYMPALTEAYYRHLPILAVTCCRSNANVGHYVDQVTDRSQLPKDIANVSVYAQTIHCSEDEWDVMVKVNKAILGLKQNGGGPCHINLATIYKKDFSVKEIPPCRVIHRYTSEDSLPDIPKGTVGIFVGAHTKWTNELTNAVNKFCGIYNAAVFCDHTSNYNGDYRVLFPLIADQFGENIKNPEVDLVIHIGYVSNVVFKGKQMWRVNEDGEIRDTFRTMTDVFQMSETKFFQRYTDGKEGHLSSFAEQWQQRYVELLADMPEVPLSNIWVAKQMSANMPENSVLHMGIRNSVRSWGYFEIPNSVLGYCNTGGFGIDGGVSSLIGASLIHPEKIYYGVFGDLLFFYDMNILGNREIKNNVRILVINNGLGQEFKNYSCFSSMFGDDADMFIAAKGHFGNHSKTVIKHFADSLGFEYLSASTKEEFKGVAERFLTSELTTKPMLLEVHTNTEDESAAFKAITTITKKTQLKLVASDIISRPEFRNVRNLVKKIIKR